MNSEDEMTMTLKRLWEDLSQVLTSIPAGTTPEGYFSKLSEWVAIEAGRHEFFRCERGDRHEMMSWRCSSGINYGGWSHSRRIPSVPTVRVMNFGCSGMNAAW